MGATRECSCVCVRAGGACADVRVPVYLVVYVYCMIPFDVVEIVCSLNITVRQSFAFVIRSGERNYCDSRLLLLNYYYTA